MSEKRSSVFWRWAAGIAVLYLVLAVLYGVTIPVFETPDENGHYAYIHELTEGRGLPVQGAPSGRRVTGYVASHPPLYYALCAALTFWVPDDVDFRAWAWRNPLHANGFPGSVGNKNFVIHTEEEAFPWHGTPLTVHIARWVSALLGAVAVVGTYGTAWELTGGNRRRPAIALGAAALTAFNPMFVFTGGRVSNDAAVAAFGALTIWGATRLATRGLSRRGLVLLGLVQGLTILSKLSGLALLPAVVLAFLVRSGFGVRGSVFGVRRSALRVPHQGSNTERRTQNPEPGTQNPEPFPRLLVDALLLFGTVVLLCGWWFVRNQILYGELLGINAWLSHTATVRPEPLGVLEVIPQLEGLEMSYWGVFGWFNIFTAPWMYRAWWVLVRLSVVGLAVLLADQWTRWRWPRSAQAGLAVVFVAFLGVFASVWRFIMMVLGAQGRYLFPAIAASSTLMMLGLARWLGRYVPFQEGSSARETGRWALALGLAAAHIAATVISLFAFVLPSYATPRPLAEADLPPDLTRFDATITGTPIQILGGRVEVEEAYPGDVVPVVVYWRALAPPEEDYIAHIRLLTASWERVGGTDGYPGRGTFPTTLWEPGVIYEDRYSLPIDPAAETPVVLGLEAGLRRDEEPPFPFLLPSGEVVETLFLDMVPLRSPQPASTEVSHPVGARLGGVLTLIGADLPSESVQAGQTLTVTLVWRAEGEIGTDYTVFLHLFDGQGALVAQTDAPPLEGAYPTRWWAPGEVVRDSHVLSLPEGLPSGRYTLYVGLYEPATMARLPATDADGNPFANDVIPLATLEVR